MKRAIVSVTNDITTDQRVYRTCQVLMDKGYHVTVVGRRRPWSVDPRKPFDTFRFRLIFNKGFLFYAEYNTRLFFYLLFKKADLFWANDLDTLLPNYQISSLRKKPLVYDSHEYFCYVPELMDRPFVQRFWLRLENKMFPKIKHLITVNDSIASCYESTYGKKPLVVRNMASRERIQSILAKKKTREELGLPTDKEIIILQGAGINIQRGAEEAVLAMHHVENVVLLIVGGGDAWKAIEELVEKEELQEKIMMIKRVPYEELIQYTASASIGLSLDKPSAPNYLFSLPNKLFDYIHAGVPVLASSLPEVQKVVLDYKIGSIIPSHDPQAIANEMNLMLNDLEQRTTWKENLKIAAEELCWENERKVLEKMIDEL